MKGAIPAGPFVVARWCGSPRVADLAAGLVIVGVLLSPPRAAAQRPSLGFTIHRVSNAGPGVERSCLERGYRTGLGGRFSVGVLARFLSLDVTTIAHFIGTGPTCIDGFPPTDGTYVDDDRVALLAAPFVTTEVRLRGSLGPRGRAPEVTLGVGNAWRSSHNLPYVLTGVSLPVVSGRRSRVVIEADYLMLRVTSDRYRRTWQNFQLVAVDSLGQVHHWSRALTIGVSVEVSL